MSPKTPHSLNRREFLGRTGRGALASGGLFAAGAARMRIAAAQETPAPATANGLQVGWATVSITPDAPVQLHGQFHERVSTTVLDPCMATALALESVDAQGNTEQAVLVSCDLVNLDREVMEEVRRRVAQRLPDFDSRKLFANCTHTHTGPTLMRGLYKDPDPGVMGPVEYAPFFCDRMEEVIVAAWAARRPGAMSRAVGHAAVGFNRIARYHDGSSKMYGSSADPGFRALEGGHDHGLESLFLWDDHDTLTGIVINIACPSQVVEGKDFVSADFWGPVREELRKLYSDDLFVYPMVSAAGDQSPRDLVRRGRGEPDMRSEPGMHEMARRIVGGVRDAFETAQTERLRDPVFRHHAEWLALPARRVTHQEAAAARAEIARIEQAGPVQPGSPQAGSMRRMGAVAARYDTQGDAPTYTMDLHVIRLGDIAIATNPFELYLDYGLQIKARSRAPQTLLAQLTGDRGLYLPTRAAVNGGAYGSRITENLVGPEGGDALVAHTLEVINGMWEA